MSFIHLRVASAYSMKYGTTQPVDLVERAREFGMPALALTDRSSLSGAIRFAKACVANGIAPIIGINLPIDLSNNLSTSKKNVDKEKSKELPRVSVLAHSDGGWAHLVRFMTGLNMNLDTNGKPCITLDFLNKFSSHSTQLHLLHGPQSPLSYELLAHREERALEVFNLTRDFFADHAIECVSHLIAGKGPGSTSHAARSLIFAREHDIDAVISNAVRMRDQQDGPIADLLDCARQLVPLDYRYIERRNAEAYLKNSEQMVNLASEIARAAGESTPRALLKTTRQWAERALLSAQRDIGLGGIHLPEPEIVGATSPASMRTLLRSRAESGIHWRYSKNLEVKAARLRLDDELATVASLGYESYFLTVADIAQMARDEGIRVAARGSGAGSLICHLLGISGVDPMRHGLLMERFCSPLRAALPDIDIDVESDRRLDIYDMVFNRYGSPSLANPGAISRVATVAMFDTYRARHAIRDTGAALGLPSAEIDILAKAMPHVRARNIEAVLKSLPELKTLNTSAPLMAMTIALAQELDGLPRHLAMHPCAVVLSDGGLLNRIPLHINASGYPMVEFDKDDVEDIGLLKLDILGVRMQSTIAYATREINKNTQTDGTDAVDIDSVSLDDEATYQLIQSTRTLGIFQIESPGQRELVGKLNPRTFNDLIIDISLFRPGPVKSDMIAPFLNSRHGFTSRDVIHPTLAPILEETEGVVVFHEQVISIIATMTGISLAGADEKRRDLGSQEGQQEVCDWFFPAATANGYQLDVVTKIWEILRAFASFGFCKAHAAAFALPTYQSAWLKTHYPAEFLAGVLTHEPGMYPRRLLLDEARQIGIGIATLDVNKSGATYLVESLNDKKSIRIALSTIAGISSAQIKSIINARPYLDLADFIARSGASSPVTESLILTGGFDELHAIDSAKTHSSEIVTRINHRDLLLHLRDIESSPAKKNIGGGQMTFGFTPPTLIASGLPDLNVSERVRHEVERLGMDITHHMLEFYAPFLNAIGAVRSCDLLKQRSSSQVLVAGIKVALQTPPIRSGRRVIFLTLDDGYGCSDSTFFTDRQESRAGLLYSTSLLLVQGVTRRTGDKGISIRATNAWDLRIAYEKWQTSKVAI
jgi:error-prone DNA polymerase